VGGTLEGRREEGGGWGPLHGGAWVVAGAPGYPRQKSTYMVEEGFFLYFLVVFFLVFAPAF
jgi:hypothetical protein